MPIQVLMPALSPTMEKGNLAKWLKKEGEPIKPGDIIAEIETDKATMEVEAADEGTLGKILVPEGTADVAVNTPIADDLGRGRGCVVAQRRQPAVARQQKAAESAPPAAAEKGDGETNRAPAPSAAGGAAEAASRTRAGRAGRHRDGDDHRARGLARCHGGGDAPGCGPCS